MRWVVKTIEVLGDAIDAGIGGTTTMGSDVVAATNW
jgi:hypothetical protein